MPKQTIIKNRNKAKTKRMYSKDLKLLNRWHVYLMLSLWVIIPSMKLVEITLTWRSLSNSSIWLLNWCTLKRCINKQWHRRLSRMATNKITQYRTLFNTFWASYWTYRTILNSIAKMINHSCWPYTKDVPQKVDKNFEKLLL